MQYLHKNKKIIENKKKFEIGNNIRISCTKQLFKKDKKAELSQNW